MKTKLKSLWNPGRLALLSLAAMPCLVCPVGAQTPTLGITNDSSGITVSWPVAEASSVLQWTASLDPMSWNTYPAPPSVSADESSLLVLLDPLFQATNPYAFFRLASNSVATLGPPTVVTTPDLYTCNLNK